MQYTANYLMFRRNLVLPSSGYKTNIPEDGGGVFLRSFVNFVSDRSAQSPL